MVTLITSQSSGGERRSCNGTCHNASHDKTTPWGLANSLNQAICTRIFGPMYGVYYPWRKTGDLYVAMDGHPIRCCQCDQDIPVDAGLKAWRDHIRSHARRKLINPIIFVGADNDGKVHAVQEALSHDDGHYPGAYVDGDAPEEAWASAVEAIKDSM